jgi:GH25 family lysozyme M1 (1,4-beta-N-acetylmuramidase)
MAWFGPDTSAYQAGINPRGISANYWFFKLTEGAGYVSAAARAQFDGAAGKIRTAYHFARPSRNSPVAEANFFVAHVRSVCPGVEQVALDWEEPGHTGDVGWAKTWLDTVASALGKPTVVYMSQAVENAHDWRSCTSYALWVARYPDMKVRAGYTPVGSYGRLRNWSRPWAWQFTSTGRLAGYGGNLDLNIIYYALSGAQTGAGDMATAGDIWGAPLSGVAAGDRLQGIDAAANGAFGIVRDPYVDADGISGALRDRLAWVDKRVREMAAGGVTLTDEAVAKLQAAVGTPTLTDAQVQALAAQITPAVAAQLAPALYDLFKQQLTK